jgi:dynein heavy chain
MNELRNKKSLFVTAHNWEQQQVEIAKMFLMDIEATAFHLEIEKVKRTADFLVRNFTDSKLAHGLRDSITNVFQIAPIISTLRSKDLEDRHWARIEGMISLPGLRTSDLCVQELVDYDAPQNSDEFSSIAVEAENEKTLVQMIDEILLTWASIKFEILTNTDSNVLILGGLGDITDVLDQTTVKCSTIRGSRYICPIKSLVDKTITVLHRVANMLKLISSMQKQWQYLRNIFKDSDIQRQLSNVFNMFHEVENDLKN